MISSQKYYSAMTYIRFIIIVAVGIFLIFKSHKSHAYIDFIEPGLAHENIQREHEKAEQNAENACRKLDRQMNEKAQKEREKREKAERKRKDKQTNKETY